MSRFSLDLRTIPLDYQKFVTYKYEYDKPLLTKYLLLKGIRIDSYYIRIWEYDEGYCSN